jgi:recombination protein RecT
VAILRTRLYYALFFFILFIGGMKMTQKASNNKLQQAVENMGNTMPQKQVQPTGVDPYRKAQSYLKAMLPAITEALPKSKGMDAERLSRITLTTLKQNPKLLECSIESLLSCVLTSAQLGLEPNLLGSCYFIPYKNTVSFQIGFRGMIDLCTRSGEVISITSNPVYEKDVFVEEYGSREEFRHIPNRSKDRGKIIGFYAYANMRNGGFKAEYMSIEEIEKIRDNHSISYKFDKQNSIWGLHFEAMASKTVIKKLIKTLPISIETQSAVAMDETTRKDITSEAMPIYDMPAEEYKVEILDKQEENVG